MTTTDMKKRLDVLYDEYITAYMNKHHVPNGRNRYFIAKGRYDEALIRYGKRLRQDAGQRKLFIATIVFITINIITLGTIFYV